MKFTPKGSITLRVQVETNPQVLGLYSEEYEENQNFKVLKISVQDTGIGIDPKKRSALFKPFSQIDTGSTRKYTGTGLGLTISQNLVRRLSNNKSEIAFDSKLGEGTTFHFHLPVLVLPPVSPNVTEIERRENSLDLLARTIFVICIPSVETRNFFLSELRAVDTFMKRYCSTLESTTATVKELRAEYPQKLILCFIDTGTGSDETILNPFMEKVHPLNVDLFLITHINQRNHYHSWFTSTTYPVTIITKPFYKDHVLNSCGGALQRKLNKEGKEIQAPSPSSSHTTKATTPEPTEDPTTATHTTKATQPEPTEDPTTALPQVLMVEDNKMNQRVQQRMLKLMKADSDVALNGAIGLEQFTKRIDTGIPYALILMDFHMPEMDGKEATLRIRALEKEKNLQPTHIIGLTADSGDKGEGMCAIISKPIKKASFHA
eukprot:CAMPEP_0206207682 /NCGR_PEP_ID=MMETSP0166-20121206/15739_1 /ASSEMBLY_ACC=CAM_ASM_000260 /TAXON_ID=95228 /ORGANISM="Vannella robusta, Strain DIVA3 518/3/11/1/6" /LENGTH=433 /DNA_ID=CAMNT_0053628495 /DNA_START=188 /DNA_END=1485 /DNA_ORIENTATION=-